MPQKRYHPYPKSNKKTNSGPGPAGGVQHQTPQQPSYTEEEANQIEELKKMLAKSCYLTAQMFKQRDAEIMRKAREWDTQIAELRQVYGNMHMELTRLIETSCCKHHAEENRRRP